jgi:hypothetical protein
MRIIPLGLAIFCVALSSCRPRPIVSEQLSGCYANSRSGVVDLCLGANGEYWLGPRKSEPDGSQGRWTLKQDEDGDPVLELTNWTRWPDQAVADGRPPIPGFALFLLSWSSGRIRIQINSDSGEYYVKK